MPEVDFVVVGGSKDDVRFWAKQVTTQNIKFLGYMPPDAVQQELATFDICLLPNQEKVYVNSLEDSSKAQQIGAFTSPLKMFEYMSAGIPIVSSDLPVLREVLDENDAFCSPPDDVMAWVNAIHKLKDTSLRKRLGDSARTKLATYYTWDARARYILQDLAMVQVNIP